MKLFSAEQVPQGSDWWWTFRRGIPTSSNFDKILTPKTLKPSASQDKLCAELAADVANLNPNWFSDRMTKPPNHAVAEGIAREAESRRYLEYTRECTAQLVGFCLHDNGMWGASPDALLIGDAGTIAGTLELKNPQLDTQVEYLMAGELPSEYRCQCHGHLIVTGLPRCTFLSYCPGLDPFLVEVERDDFTAKLTEQLELFTKKYLAVLDRLHLRGRFDQQRESCLQHFPETGE